MDLLIFVSAGTLVTVVYYILSPVKLSTGSWACWRSSVELIPPVLPIRRRR